MRPAGDGRARAPTAPERDHHQGRRSRTRSPRRRCPAAPPTPCCTCWPWPTRPASQLSIDDFDEIAWKTPAAGGPQAGGRFVAPDLWRAGGVPLVVERLEEAGVCSGRRDHRDREDDRRRGRRALRRPRGRRWCVRWPTPLAANGGFAILRGNLAPEGCVVKLAGHERMRAQRPGAGVRVARRTPSRRSRRGSIKPGEVVVIRNEGPVGGPGMREMLGGHRGASWGRGWATPSRSSPTGASPAPPTASWPATWPPRRRAAGRSPRCATATRRLRRRQPGAATGDLRRRARRPVAAYGRAPRATTTACWASTPTRGLGGRGRAHELRLALRTDLARALSRPRFALAGPVSARNS